MKELIRFINKEKHKQLLELFMILDEVSKQHDIVSFKYDGEYLTIQVSLDEYYRIKMLKEVI